jgi:hypothetical protein
MAELQNFDIAGSYQRGLAFGTAQRKDREADQRRNMLTGLAPQVIAGDPGAYEQAAAIDPEVAGQYQKAGDDQTRRLKGAIDYIEQAQKTGNPQAVEAAFQQVRPYLARFGQPPPATFAEAEPKFNEAKARIAMLGADASGLPTGFRELDMKARAAGFQPGTPEYQHAMRVGVGVEGRPATGGFGFEVVEGLDGRKRMSRKNPRTGVVEIYDETTGDFSPMGGGASLNGGAPAPAAMTVNFDGLTPEQNQRIAQTASLMRQAGYPDADIDSFVNAQGNPPQYVTQNGAPVSPPTMPPGRANPALGVGQSAAEKAGAETSAREQAQIAALPARGDAEAENERKKAAASAVGKYEGERDAKSAKDVLDAHSTLALLDGAKVLLGRATGGQLGAARDSLLGAFNVSTEGRRATAGLKVLAAKLVAKVPRFEGPQSNIDVAMYQQAAGDLANDNLTVGERLAALQTMRELAQKAAQSPAPQQQDRRGGSDIGDLLTKYGQ